MDNLLEDNFKISEIIKSNFDNVRRIKAKSKIFKLSIELDINTNIYKVNDLNEYFFSLHQVPSTMASSNYEEEELENPLFDQFEYVMRGRVFEIKQENKTEDLHIGISFGGLLLLIIGNKVHLKNIKNDTVVYLLLKKIN